MGKGRPPAVTLDEVEQHLEHSERPIWSAQELAEEFDVAPATIRDRCEDLLVRGRIAEYEFPSMKAYYSPGRWLRTDLDTETAHRRDLVDHYTDKWVGLRRAPWTAIHPRDGPAEAGDKIQISVVGEPGQWSEFTRRHWSERVESLEEEEKAAFETQALVSGTLYAKPTTPIEHIDYPDDYELEKKIGARRMQREGDKPELLVAGGPKDYLIDPFDDAVFLGDVTVDEISPKGEGYEDEVPSEEVDLEEQLEQVEEWREENIDEEYDPDEPGL